jgi:hypothetical protein
VCELPFVAGDCQAYFPVFWHNPETGFCEEAIYGGCGGNDNRFATLEQCTSLCNPPPPETSCEVNGVIYPDGANDVPDPMSCNTCSCENGQVTACTEINCPSSCEDGMIFGTECAECGPGDGCVTTRSGCFPACETQEECSAMGAGFCLDGQCRNICL